MRTNGFCEAYVLEEVAIKLADANGNVIDSVFAPNVGVTVEFDYEPGNSEDDPQVYVRAVKSAGAAFESDNTTLNCWLGFDMLAYMTEPDLDLMKEEMISRIEGRKQASYDDDRIDQAKEARAERNAGRPICR